MSKDDLFDRHYDLLFAVRRSIRYHDRREGFFATLRHGADFLVIVIAGLGSLAAMGMLTDGEPAPGAAVIPLFSAFTIALVLVFRVDERGRVHKTLKQRFILLETRLIACRRNPTDELLDELEGERLVIEMDEPPILRVLDTMCHNELIHAEGADRTAIHEVSFGQRLFSPFFDFRPKTLYTADP